MNNRHIIGEIATTIVSSCNAKLIGVLSIVFCLHVNASTASDSNVISCSKVRLITNNDRYFVGFKNDISKTLSMIMMMCSTCMMIIIEYADLSLKI